MKWRWLILLAFLGIGGFSVFYERPTPAEPVYCGKSVSSWALDLNSPSEPTRDAAKLNIQAFGDDAVPSLVRMLQTPNPIFGRPIRAVGTRLPRTASTFLFRLVNPFRAPAMRAAAAHAIGLMGPSAQAAVPALTKALHDEKTVAWYSALALAKRGNPGVQALVQSLTNTAPDQCGFVCYALSTQGVTASNAVPLLAKLLETGRSDVSEQAGLALSNVGPLAVPVLTHALEHTNLAVRLVAIRGLAVMGPIARGALPKLREKADLDEAAAKAAAVEALLQIRPTAALVLSAVTNALRDVDREVRGKAIQALSRAPEAARRIPFALIGALDDPSPDVRASVVDILGKLAASEPAVLSALEERLRDGNLYVRQKATEALNRARAPSVSGP